MLWGGFGKIFRRLREGAREVLLISQPKGDLKATAENDEIIANFSRKRRAFCYCPASQSIARSPGKPVECPIAKKGTNESGKCSGLMPYR